MSSNNLILAAIKVCELCDSSEAVSDIVRATLQVVHAPSLISEGKVRSDLLRRNFDYGEGIGKMLDDSREKIKSKEINKLKNKKKKKAYELIADFKIAKEKEKNKSVAPIDSYCESKSNKEYWKKLKEYEDYSKAVDDFIEYAEKVKC